MPPPPPPSGNQGDHSTAILWIIIAIFVASLTVWYAFKPYLVTAYLTVKLYEVHYLNLLLSNRFIEQYRAILNALTSPATLDPIYMLRLGDEVGVLIRLPLSILLGILAVAIYFGNTAHNFKSTYSIRSLVQHEKQTWPQLTPIVGLDLLKEDIDSGRWAMAMTPMQFCKKHRLIHEVRPERQPGMSRKQWNKVDVVLHKGLANQLFVLQLGAVWSGAEHIPLYAQALFAIFAARINQDTGSATTLLHQLALSSASSLNFSGVSALWKKHQNTKLVKTIIASHAYVYTVLASMLEKAREDGVQTTADFLWLKPLDRTLWYVLNCVGRQTAFVEVAGVFAHWLAEKEAGIKLLVPMVETATQALDVALKEVLYKPDE